MSMARPPIINSFFMAASYSKAGEVQESGRLKGDHAAASTDQDEDHSSRDDDNDAAAAWTAMDNKDN